MADGGDPMDMPVNSAGDPCPSCGTGVVECVAVTPAMTEAGDIVLPHNYGICRECHGKQYLAKYGYTPEDAPNQVKAPPKLVFKTVAS